MKRSAESHTQLNESEVKWETKKGKKKMREKFINILPTIVAIWFALWPQRARDTLTAIRAEMMQHLRHLLDDEESALSDDDADARAAAHDRKQEIRVNFASCTPHAAACWGTGCTGWPKGLHNSFHLWQDINQCGQRAVASPRLAPFGLLGGRRQAAPKYYASDIWFR